MALYVVEVEHVIEKSRILFYTTDASYNLYVGLEYMDLPQEMNEVLKRDVYHAEKLLIDFKFYDTNAIFKKDMEFVLYQNIETIFQVTVRFDSMQEPYEETPYVSGGQQILAAILKALAPIKAKLDLKIENAKKSYDDPFIRQRLVQHFAKIVASIDPDCLEKMNLNLNVLAAAATTTTPENNNGDGDNQNAPLTKKKTNPHIPIASICKEWLALYKFANTNNIEWVMEFVDQFTTNKYANIPKVLIQFFQHIHRYNLNLLIMKLVQLTFSTVYINKRDFKKQSVRYVSRIKLRPQPTAPFYELAMNQLQSKRKICRHFEKDSKYMARMLEHVETALNQNLEILHGTIPNTKNIFIGDYDEMVSLLPTTKYNKFVKYQNEYTTEALFYLENAAQDITNKKNVYCNLILDETNKLN